MLKSMMLAIALALSLAGVARADELIGRSRFIDHQMEQTREKLNEESRRHCENGCTGVLLALYDGSVWLIGGHGSRSSTEEAARADIKFDYGHLVFKGDVDYQDTALEYLVQKLNTM